MTHPTQQKVRKRRRSLRTDLPVALAWLASERPSRPSSARVDVSRSRVDQFSPRGRLPVTAPLAAAAATATLGLGACFVDIQGTTVEVLTVEAFNGRTSGVIGHGDERETAGAAGLTIGDDRDLFDVAVCGESLAEGVFGRIETCVAYVDLQGNTLFEWLGDFGHSHAVQMPG